MSDNWTPEQHRHFFLTGEEPVATPAEQARVMAAERKQVAPEPVTDTSFGMNPAELALAGAGGELSDLVQGVKEKGRIAFRPEGKEGDQLLKDIARERAERELINQKLYSNPSANFGRFGAQALIAGASPARIPAQMMTQGVLESLKPGTRAPGGIGAELINSALHGGEAALTEGLVGIPVKAAGKILGAATNRFTPEGREAMRLDEAARRIGVDRSIGSLDPTSQSYALEMSMPGYTKTVADQAKKLSEAARVVKDVPSATGKSTTERVLEGEGIRSAIEEAGNNLKNVGTGLWAKLDDYVVQNNLPPVRAAKSHALLHDINNRYTPVKKGVANIEKNPIIERIAQEDSQSADLIKTLFYDPKKAPSIPFSELHQAQTAVGKALAQAEKDARAPGASMDVRRYKTELKNLYGSLMTDVDSWGTKNPTAKEMYDQAKGFWRDVVVPGAITNKTYQKATMGTYGANPRGYSEPSRLYADVMSNPRSIQELFPYMDPKGRDIIETLQTMPHVAQTLETGKPFQSSAVSPLAVMSGMIAGSPFQLVRGLASHLPGFRGMTESVPAKKLYFSRDVAKDTPLGRVAYGAAQYPQEESQGYLRRLRSAQ